MLIYGLLIACIGAQEVDVRSIPAGERIAYVNKLADCHKGRNADKYYQDAFAHYVPLYTLYPEDDPEKLDRYMHVSQTLNGLACADRWTADEKKVIEEWLAANEETIKALKKAAGRRRYFHPLEHESGRLHTATIEDMTSAGRFRDFTKLAAIVSNGHALQGEWDEAYRWNLCIQRMADHAIQRPFAIQQQLGFGIEEIAQDHLRALLQRQAPEDLAKLAEEIRAGDDLRCTSELTGKVEDLWTYDYIEAWYDWVEHPDRHPDLTAIVEFFYRDQPAVPELAGLTFGGLKAMPEKHFKSVEELKEALAGSSVKHDYRVTCQGNDVYERWSALPFHEAWKQRHKFVEDYCSVLVQAPSIVAAGCGGSMVALWYKREVVSELEREATVTIIALLQFRKENARLPEHLAEVIPKYLAEVPIDVFSGKPLIYRVDKNGKDLTIYSIGMDQVDDGGRPTKGLEETGDLVFWPPPEVKIEGR